MQARDSAVGQPLTVVSLDDQHQTTTDCRQLDTGSSDAGQCRGAQCQRLRSDQAGPAEVTRVRLEDVSARLTVHGLSPAARCLHQQQLGLHAAQGDPNANVVALRAQMLPNANICSCLRRCWIPVTYRLDVHVTVAPRSSSRACRDLLPSCA